MRPGSVIVDLAADGGGNVELTQPGAVIDAQHGLHDEALLLQALPNESVDVLEPSLELRISVCISIDILQRVKEIV